MGAYNAACTQLKGEACTAARQRYASCVYRNLPPELKGDEAPHAAPGSAARSEKKTKPAAAAAPAVTPLVAVKVTP